MLELIGDIVVLILGPKAWREMSGPGVVAGALLWGVMGILVALAGGASLAHVGAAQEPWMAWAEVVLGLAVLGDVALGVMSFLRANRERT
jgi:hypothetical protein